LNGSFDGIARHEPTATLCCVKYDREHILSKTAKPEGALLNTCRLEPDFADTAFQPAE